MVSTCNIEPALQVYVVFLVLFSSFRQNVESQKGCAAVFAQQSKRYFASQNFKYIQLAYIKLQSGYDIEMKPFQWYQSLKLHQFKGKIETSLFGMPLLNHNHFQPPNFL